MRSRGLWRKVKKHRSYTVEEAANCLGRCRGTVRRWIKAGLPVLSEQRPILILGADLIDYLQASTPPRQRCAIDECPCFSCKVPRRPAFNAVEYHASGTTGGNMRALCDVCSSVMHKHVSSKKLEALAQKLDVTIIPLAKAPPTQNEPKPPSIQARDTTPNKGSQSPLE